MPDTEDIEVDVMGEPEIRPDVVTDPEDTHVEGVDAPEKREERPAPVEPTPDQAPQEGGEDGNSEAAEA